MIATRLSAPPAESKPTPTESCARTSSATVTNGAPPSVRARREEALALQHCFAPNPYRRSTRERRDRGRLEHDLVGAGACTPSAPMPSSALALERDRRFVVDEVRL